MGFKDFQFKGEEGGNPPDDKVWRCGVTLNQQLMSEKSKPHTQLQTFRGLWCRREGGD